MTFCVDKLEPDPHLRADHGLLRDAALAITTNAHALRDTMLAQAEQHAAAIVQQAHEQAGQIVAQAEQDTVARLQDYLAAFETQYAAFAVRAEPLVIALALSLFDRLVLSMDERDRIVAMVQRLLQEVPAKLSEPLLHLHPSDLAHVPEAPWPLKANPALTPGTAQLIAGSGEWRVEFDLAVATLRSALASHCNDNAPAS
ncbi:flagellar biosynthesis/type III secretory pathway protein FliH [Actimicrobium sp. GrIS 1.19]|uniref:FliH/SctL family protein n=1 Tax=Actimicrobium sp. GrIS 1.19 TaxID=3071708 RepID=UPI002E09004F|nr:flagellar biosynthesis/type III secretory pathway protein FliH [Actimicrobium sp. GrIS 1.19]